MKVSVRLTLVFSVVLIVAILVGAIGTFGMRDLLESEIYMYENRVRGMEYISTAESIFKHMRIQSRDVTIACLQDDSAGAISSYEEFERLVDDFLSTIEKSMETATTDELVSFHKHILETFDHDYLPKVRDVIERSIDDIPGHANASVINADIRQVTMHAQRIESLLRSLVSINSVLAERSSRDNEQMTQAYITLLVVLLVIMLVVVTAAAIVITRSITRPLQEMSNAAISISEGKLDVKLALRSKSELGVLADSFRQMAHSVEGIISDMQAMTQKHADGDFEHFINADDYKGSYRDMVLGINSMMKMTVEELQTIVEYLEGLKSGGEIGRIRRFPGKKAVISDTIDAIVGKVHIDILTGIYNRRYMEETMSSIIKTMLRSGGGKLSVLMMDIDFFKKYNDTYGHDEGDNCLRKVARAISKSITRQDDFAARYGGEEFVIVLPNTDEDGAHYIAEKVLENVRALRIPHESSEAAPYVTLSIGAVTGNVKVLRSPSDYIKGADEQLYVSKSTGRNKATTYRS